MHFNDFQKELKKAAPKTSLNWESYNKRRHKKNIIIGIFLILILSFFTYFHLKKIKSESSLIQTVISYENISKGTKITEDLLSMKAYERHQLPEGYTSDIQDLIGLYSVQNISKNSIITNQDLKKTINSNSLALNLEEGIKAFTIDGDWVENTFPKISLGDNIDIIVSNPNRSIEDTVFLVRGAEVIDFIRDIKSSSGSYITIKTTEDESRNLLYARSHKLLFSVTLSQ